MTQNPAPPKKTVMVAEFIELLTRSADAVRERLGASVFLLPLEPWVQSDLGLGREATLTGRAQLVKTTVGRQAPALHAGPLALPASEQVELGRSRQAALRIDQPTVSRIHAELTPQGDVFQIRDRESYNGTLVNGRVLGPGETVLLQNGDVIALGEAQLLFGSAEHFAELLAR